MKKILFLLLLPFCSNAQYGLLNYTSELYSFIGDPTYGVVVLQNDLKPQYTGGVFWYCDTCTLPTDSIITFDRVLGNKWRKVSEVPLSTDPSGKTGKVIGSDGTSLAWFDVPTKRIETYSGTTNGSGVYTLTYGTAYSTAPNVQVSIKNGGTGQYARVYNQTTTGCDIHVYQYTTTTLLTVLLMTGTLANVSGIDVEILVTEK